MGTNPMISSVQARFGSAEEFDVMLDRSAILYGVPEELRRLPDVRSALVQATQYCIQLALLPVIQVNLLEQRQRDLAGNWQTVYKPDLGEKAWKDFADRAAFLGGFRYAVEAIELTGDEVRTETAKIPEQRYSNKDAGFKCRVLRTDHAEVFKLSGRVYDPPWSLGFWRRFAYQNPDGAWESDKNIPQRTPADTAERRARKAALMRVFTPIPLDERDERDRFQRLYNYVEEETTPASRTTADSALFVERKLNRDEEGMVWA